MIRDISLILVSVLVSSLITIFFLVKQPASVVIIDDELLFRDFIISISNSIKTSEKEEIEAKIKIHKQAVDIFNDKIEEIAQKNNLLVLKKSAVMAGSEDQTKQAQELLNGLMIEVRNDQ